MLKKRQLLWGRFWRGCIFWLGAWCGFGGYSSSFLLFRVAVHTYRQILTRRPPCTPRFLIHISSSNSAQMLSCNLRLAFLTHVAYCKANSMCQQSASTKEPVSIADRFHTTFSVVSTVDLQWHYFSLAFNIPTETSEFGASVTKLIYYSADVFRFLIKYYSYL